MQHQIGARTFKPLTTVRFASKTTDLPDICGFKAINPDSKSIVAAARGLSGVNKATVRKNRIPDDGLVVSLAPCFKTGGFDIHSDRECAALLYPILPHLGLSKPVLVCFGPVRTGKKTGYFYKIISGVEWNRVDHS